VHNILIVAKKKKLFIGSHTHLSVRVDVFSDAATHGQWNENILRCRLQHLQHWEIVQHALAEACDVQEDNLPPKAIIVSLHPLLPSKTEYADLISAIVVISFAEGHGLPQVSNPTPDMNESMKIKSALLPLSMNIGYDHKSKVITSCKY
jgi:hypothetical protein